MINPPTHSIIETAALLRRVKELGLASDELVLIYDAYSAQPDYGEVVRRTGGLRKGRIAKDGEGKRGGYRVFSFYLDKQNPVFLLWLIDKAKDDTVSDAQEAVFKALTMTLKKELRR